VFLGSGVVLSQAAHGDPSLGLTPLINSARRCAERHTLRLAASSKRKAPIGSPAFFIREDVDGGADPRKVLERVVMNELFLFSITARVHNTHACTQTHTRTPLL